MKLSELSNYDWEEEIFKIFSGSWDNYKYEIKDKMKFRFVNEFGSVFSGKDQGILIVNGENDCMIHYKKYGDHYIKNVYEKVS